MRTVLLGIILVSLTACQSPTEEPTSAPTSRRYDIEVEPVEWLKVVEPGEVREIGRSVEGKPIVAQSFGSAGEGRRTVLVMATIHGNEAAGTPLVLRLADELRARPELWATTRVVIVPIVNPDGMAARRRTNAAGVDLNRNFPAKNYTKTRDHGETPLSAPESAALARWIDAERPALIVSIHQPLAVIDWNGPIEALARKMALASGLPAKAIGTRPGSLGAWASEELGIPVITMELRGGDQAESRETLWKRYGAALIAAIEDGSASPAIPH